MPHLKKTHTQQKAVLSHQRVWKSHIRAQQEAESCDSLPGPLTADFLCQKEDRLGETLLPEESEMFKNRQKLWS